MKNIIKSIVKNIIFFIVFILLIIICSIGSAILFRGQDEEVENIAKTDETETVTTEKKELFEEYYDKAEGIMYLMTLEEKVGQMFLSYYSADDAQEEITEEKPGGYILFEKDFENHTKESILEEINNCQEASKIPLFFGVDEEGGTTVRVSSNEQFRNEPFLSPQEIYNKYGMNKILSDSTEKTQLLKEIGLNMNIAPVVDVPTSEESFIYDRSFGTDVNRTNEFAEKIITQMNLDKMISVMKHFPGYGDNEDTHEGIAIDERPYEQFTDVDFKPFIQGIKAGAPIILVSHNIVNCIDEEFPASLSPKMNKILREDLGFSGLIMTDDLSMKAIKNTSNKPAVQAVLAGNDIIISSNFKEEKKQILDAISNEEINEEQINDAVRKILACKLYYGIIN